MDRESLRQWMSEARLEGNEDSDGFLTVASGNLEISVGYVADVDLVVCFASILELTGVEDAQRIEVLEQSLALNGVGSLPPDCVVSYEDAGDVVYLLWQQSPDQLDASRLETAFRDFETAAEQIQNHLQGLLSGDAGGLPPQDLMIKV